MKTLSSFLAIAFLVLTGCSSSPGADAGVLQQAGRKFGSFSSPAAAPSASNLNVFVATTGNDSGLGTQADPFLTVDRALAVSSGWGGDFHINIAAGTYQLSNTGYFHGNPASSTASPLVIIGGVADQLGTITASSTSSCANTATCTVTMASLTGIRSGAAASIVAGATSPRHRVTGVTGYTAADVGSQFVITGAASTANNGTWQIFAVNSATSIDIINANGVNADANNGAISWQDSFEGSFIEALTGTAGNIGQRRMVRSNTTTSFQVNNTFPSAIAVNDTFSVEKPNVILQLSLGRLFDLGNIGLINLKFQATGTTGSAVNWRQTELIMDTVEIDQAGGNGAGLGMSIVGFASTEAGRPDLAANQLWKNDTLGNPFVSTHVGAGLFMHNGTSNISATFGGPSFLMSRSYVHNIANSGVMNLASADFGSVTVNLNTQSWMKINPLQTSYPGVWTRQATPTATTGLLNVADNSFVNITGMTMSQSGGHAIVLQASKAILGTITGTSTLAGAGVGVWVDRSSYVQTATCTGGVGGATAVTGPAGNTKFGHPSVDVIQTYGTVCTADGNGVVGFQDTYADRMEP